MKFLKYILLFVIIIISFNNIKEGFIADPSILRSDPSKAGSINIRYNKQLKRDNDEGLIIDENKMKKFYDYNNRKRSSKKKLIIKKNPENLESTEYMRYENILSGNLKPRNKKYSHLRKLIIQDLPKDYNLESPEISVKPGKGQKKSSPGYGYILPKEQAMNQTSYHVKDKIDEEDKLEREMKQYQDSIDEFKQNKIGGTTGVEMCENQNYDKITCNNIGCCEYKEDKCKSKVGKNPCFHG
jgi:hypothetical protein